MKICLIIVNFNGINFLPKYLNNIIQQCLLNDIKIIVTDDNSTDNSVFYLNEMRVEYIINNGLNRGFAANLNNGIKYAQTIDDYDFFLISNNDIEFSYDFFPNFKIILDYINNNYNNFGLIGFNEINPNNKQYFNTYNFTNYSYDEIEICDEIPGFFFLITKNLIKKIGYFNEEYFMYGEDNDYFHRALKNHFIILNTNLPIMHYSEGSSSDSKKTSWYVYRNAFLFAQKNLNFLNFLKLFLSFINIIYNPFYKTSSTSAQRIKRNGFLYNNYLLIKSLVWNFKYYFKQ